MEELQEVSPSSSPRSSSSSSSSSSSAAVEEGDACRTKKKVASWERRPRGKQPDAAAGEERGTPGSRTLRGGVLASSSAPAALGAGTAWPPADLTAATAGRGHVPPPHEPGVGGEVHEPPMVRPFEFDTPMTACEWVKAVLLAPFFLLRLLLLFLPLALLALPFALLAPVGLKPEQKLSGFRRALIWPVRLTARVLLFVLGYYWIRTRGELAPAHARRPGGPCAPVLVSNHISFVETIYFVWYCMPIPVAKTAVRQIPLLGRMAAASCLLVDRGDPSSKAATEREIRARAQDAAAGHAPRLHVYAEGVVTNGGSLISFKNGAFLPGLPVQPVLLSYPHRRLNPFASWMNGGPSSLTIMFRLGLQAWNSMTVEFLPVYRPSPDEAEDPRMFARNVRDAMALHAGLPRTNHSWEDALLVLRALRAGLPEHMTVPLEFFRLREAHGTEFAEVEAALDWLAKRRDLLDARGRLDADAFARASGLAGARAERAFLSFDRDGDGFVDFREFVAELARVRHVLNGGPNVPFDEFVAEVFATVAGG